MHINRKQTHILYSVCELHMVREIVAAFHSSYQQTNRKWFIGLFTRTIWVSRHQKCYINLDINEARDDCVAVTSAGPYANYLHLAPDR